MTFTPHTGYCPMDGHDDRVTPARDNPCAPFPPVARRAGESVSPDALPEQENTK